MTDMDKGVLFFGLSVLMIHAVPEMTLLYGGVAAAFFVLGLVYMLRPAFKMTMTGGHDD